MKISDKTEIKSSAGISQGSIKSGVPINAGSLPSSSESEASELGDYLSA